MAGLTPLCMLKTVCDRARSGVWLCWLVTETTLIMVNEFVVLRTVMTTVR